MKPLPGCWLPRRRTRDLAALATGLVCITTLTTTGPVASADAGDRAVPALLRAEVVSAPTAPTAPTAPRAAGRKPKTPLGISPGFMTLDLGRKQLARDLDRMVGIGVTRIRVDLAWSTLQPRKDRYSWETSDRVLRAAGKRGIEVLGIVGYEPGWAVRFAADGTRLPPDPQLYERFVRTLVKRYADDVAAWELWNEPNLRRFWPSGPDPTAYAALASAGSSAIRAEDPRAPIVVGAMAPGDTVGSTVSPMDFLRGVYAALPRKAFDAVSVHPYCFPGFPDQEQPWNTFHRMDELRRIMVDNGDDRTRLWITEFGAPTGTSAVAVSEKKQARTVRIGIKEAGRRPYVGPMYLYSQRDAGTDKADSEQNFGLLEHGGTAKKAWKVLAQAAD